MSTILETINSPADLKKLSMPELKQLANELRTFIIDNVSKTGGHLSSSLGTVELAIAIHYVFDTPEDRLVWDVGHQAYAHKILTGRRDRMPTLRQYKGLSGFPKRSDRTLVNFHLCDFRYGRRGKDLRKEGSESHRSDRRRCNDRRYGV